MEGAALAAGSFAPIVAVEGINKKGTSFFLFEIPKASDKRLNLTGKEETFLILNDFSTVSPTRTLPNYKSPSSGSMFTSGRTPHPLRNTDTVVCSENIITLSS